jgi:hypothetical protein
VSLRDAHNEAILLPLALREPLRFTPQLKMICSLFAQSEFGHKEAALFPCVFALCVALTGRTIATINSTKTVNDFFIGLR